MSATMTMAFPSIATAPISTPISKMTKITTTTTTTACCPNCGLGLPSHTDAQAALLQAQKQIEDLQAQVRLLNQKATAAVDRWADYEDELSRLRAASTTSVATSNATHTSPPPPSSVATSSPRSSFLPSGAAARISQLLAPRKSAPNLAAQAAANSRGSISAMSSSTTQHNNNSHTSYHSSTVSVSASTDDLMEALSREKELRAAAEGKLNDTSREVEELSVTLFEQANEMVAQERRARARLEERVDVLERRDVEKRDRLEKLEGAMGRLERVRSLLEER